MGAPATPNPEPVPASPVPHRIASAGPPSEIFEGRKRFPGASESKTEFNKATDELNEYMDELTVWTGDTIKEWKRRRRLTSGERGF